jgi:hypothetical protein
VPRKLTKKHQREVVPRMAEELARSGQFLNWWAIETHLRSEGYTEARWILDNEDTRAKLDSLCREAKPD